MEKDSKIIYDVWKNDPSANKEWINRNKEWLDNFNEKLKNIEKTYGTEAAFRIAHDFLYGDPVDGIKNIKIETIDATPTVDAIPIEWLCNYAIETDNTDVFYLMFTKWYKEKENDRD